MVPETKERMRNWSTCPYPHERTDTCENITFLHPLGIRVARARTRVPPTPTPPCPPPIRDQDRAPHPPIGTRAGYSHPAPPNQEQDRLPPPPTPTWAGNATDRIRCGWYTSCVFMREDFPVLGFFYSDGI